MLTFGAGNMSASKPAPVVVPIPEGERFDLDVIMSIDLIRQHTKTEDIPSVSDEQLKLYRKASFEAAERHTNLLLFKNVQQEEIVQPPARYIEDARRFKTHRTRYSIAESRVYLTGPGTREILPAEIGSTTVKIPNRVFAHTVFDCCRPCTDGAGAIRLIYLAGYVNVDAIPAGIILGCLKYISWAVENPGDVMKTVDNRTSVSENFMKGTNDGAFASGAIDEWRRYVNEV